MIIGKQMYFVLKDCLNILELLELSVTSIVVPTAVTEQLTYLLCVNVRNNDPFLVVGPTGTGKSRVIEAGNYTKPSLRKRIFQRIKAGTKGGKAGQWSARKAQMLAKAYKKAGGGYK